LEKVERVLDLILSPSFEKTRHFIFSNFSFLTEAIAFLLRKENIIVIFLLSLFHFTWTLEYLVNLNSLGLRNLTLHFSPNPWRASELVVMVP
jgi:hypothetical protein